MTKKAILIFIYNRPVHTANLLETLRANNGADETELIFYADGPKSDASPDMLTRIAAVRDVAQQQHWAKKKTFIFSDQNQGLSASIINGVSAMLKHYDQVIVLEDDMLLSPHFLEYMTAGLNKYEHDDRVISIHGYSLPIQMQSPYFLRGADCWGWGTWKRGWQLFDSNGQHLLNEINKRKLGWEFDLDGSYPYVEMLKNQISGKNDSWAIRWHASAFLLGKFTLYPGKSLVQNVGSDDSGTHKQDTYVMQTTVSKEKVEIPEIPVRESENARSKIIKHFLHHAGLKTNIKRFLKWGY